MLKIIKPHLKPLTVLIYGRNRIGKTTFGAEAPSPIIIDYEGKANYAMTDSVQPKTFTELLDFITYLAKEKHDYKTIVIDSADHLLMQMEAEYCKLHEATDINDKRNDATSFGKGNSALKIKLSLLFQRIEKLQSLKPMNLIIIGKVKKTMSDEGTEDYSLSLNDKISTFIKDKCDAILFAKFERNVSNGIEVEEPRRVLGASCDPNFDGGGRVTLPDEIEWKEGKGWSVFADEFKKAFNKKIKG